LSPPVLFILEYLISDETAVALFQSLDRNLDGYLDIAMEIEKRSTFFKDLIYSLPRQNPQTAWDLPGLLWKIYSVPTAEGPWGIDPTRDKLREFAASLAVKIHSMDNPANTIAIVTRCIDYVRSMIADGRVGFS
jgi:hypothetical protein